MGINELLERDRTALVKTTMGTIGGLVVLFIVVNAAFLQDEKHPSAWFDTRAAGSDVSGLRADEVALPVPQATPAGNVTRIVFDGQQGVRSDSNAAISDATATLPSPSPALRPLTEAQSDEVAALRDLQAMLIKLGHYDGDIDGLNGPKTQKAIDDYKTSAGLQGIDLSIEQLVVSASNNLLVTAAIPTSRPEAKDEVVVETVRYQPPTLRRTDLDYDSPDFMSSDMVKLVQAGLKAFTREEIAVDGVWGKQTEQAIADFQAAFQLPVNGEIDQTLLDTMQAVGLVDR